MHGLEEDCQVSAYGIDLDQFAPEDDINIFNFYGPVYGDVEGFIDDYLCETSPNSEDCHYEEDETEEETEDEYVEEEKSEYHDEGPVPIESGGINFNDEDDYACRRAFI